MLHEYETVSGGKYLLGLMSPAAPAYAFYICPFKRIGGIDAAHAAAVDDELLTAGLRYMFFYVPEIEPQVIGRLISGVYPEQISQCIL